MQPGLGPKCLPRRISSKESFSFPCLEIRAQTIHPQTTCITQERSSLTCFTISRVACVLCWVGLPGLNQLIWHKPRLAVGSWSSKWDLSINLMLEGCSVLLSICICASLIRGNISPCLFSEQIFQTRWKARTGAWKGCSCCWGASSTAWSLPASWMWVSGPPSTGAAAGKSCEVHSVTSGL